MLKSKFKFFPLIWLNSTREYYCTYWSNKIHNNIKKYFLFSSITYSIFNILLILLSNYIVRIYNTNAIMTSFDEFHINFLSVVLVLQVPFFILGLIYYNKLSKSTAIISRFHTLVAGLSVYFVVAYFFNIFKYTNESYLILIITFAGIFALIADFLYLEIIGSVFVINKHRDYYFPEKWEIKRINSGNIENKKIIIDYFWNKGEIISDEYSITFGGWTYYKDKDSAWRYDSFFIFYYQDKVYSVRFCPKIRLLFYIFNKNKEMINKDITNLIINL